MNTHPSAPVLQPPPGAFAAALGIWGAQTGHLAPAALMAACLEGVRLVRWRVTLDDRDFNRIADLTSLAFLVLVVYQFSTRSVHGIYAILELFPYVLFPLTAAQICSARGTIRLSALFVSLRVRGTGPAHADDREIDLGRPYVLACLIAAAAGEHAGWYLPAVAAVLAWLLWPVRPRRYRASTWILVLLASVGAGFLAQHGIRELQHLSERLILGLMGDIPWAHTSADRASTAIGSIGRLKLSDRVRLRVAADRPLSAPLLLREAAYDVFDYGNWKTARTDYQTVDALPGSRTWPLAGERTGPRALHIALPFEDEVAVLPLPYGARRMRAPTGLEVQRNTYGAVTLEAPPGQVHVRVDYGPVARAEEPPGAAASTLPVNYREDFERIARELDLPGRAPAEVLERVQAFFATEFRYSLVQRGSWPGRKPLTTFIRRDRRGHCEYFASATVLLLRAGGVPARYAVGYALSEWSALERRYIARARHAHAWAEAWIDGAWQVLDTTPALWADLEDAEASALQGLLDLWAWAEYRIDRIRAGEGPLQRHYPWLLGPLTALLVWRLAHRRRIALGPSARRRPAAAVRTGAGTELDRLVAALEARGHPLRASEPLGSWLARLQASHPELGGTRALVELLALHYRQRFDPYGLPPAGRNRLRDEVERCLRALGRTR